MTAAAFFSSSRGPSGFVVDRVPFRSNFHHSSGTRSLSPLASASASAARFYQSGPGRVRQFGSAANQRQPQTTKRHLYLVLDDQKLAYSIHKLDINNNDDLDVGGGSARSPQGLPEQPVLSVALQRIGTQAQFAAVGSHIIAMSPFPYRTPMMQVGSFGYTLSFNTKTAALNVSVLLPVDLRYGYEAPIAVGNRLYVFESCAAYNDDLDGFYFRGGLHCLAADSKDDEMLWNWRPLCDSSQLCWSWDDHPSEFPFAPNTITAHVVHPRTGAIFVSANGMVDRRIWGAVKRGTFSYGTGSGKWRRRGKWLLPFQGHDHYDEEVGAWIGLHRHSSDTNGDNSVSGHLCAGNVMSGWQPPKWKFTRDHLDSIASDCVILVA